MSTPFPELSLPAATPPKPASRIRALLVLMAFLLGPLLLVFGFYAEEDWRGAWILSATKARWEAKGYSFDPKQFIPPPVPDDQNLGAIPLFRLSRDPKSGVMGFMEIKDALNATPNMSLGMTSSNNKELDKKALGSKISKLYRQRFPNGTATKTLDQLNMIFPIWQTIAEASASRSKCRFNIDYETLPNDKRHSFLALLYLVNLAEIARAHGVLSSDEGNHGSALVDIRVLLELADGASADGSFMSRLVSDSVLQKVSAIIFEGTERHSWDDAQLTALQIQLEFVQELEQGRRSFQGDLVVQILPKLQQFKTDSAEYEKALSAESVFSYHDTRFFSYTFRYWPDGWWDIRAANDIERFITEAQTIDSGNHVVAMKPIKAIEKLAAAEETGWHQWIPWAPSSDIAIFVRPIAKTQSLLDEAIIACALERYHQVHKAYPNNLTELTPFCPQPLPNDVITGKPYIYKLNPDGTFLLYSVGWNEVDDGGAVRDGHLDNGDWVWPGHGEP